MIRLRSVFLFALALWAAASGCAPRQPVRDDRDPQIVRDSSTARLAFDSGDLTLAASLYSRALRRARLIDSRSEVVDAATSLAVCRSEAGDLAAADEAAIEAEYHAGLSASRRLPAVRLLRASLAYERHDPDTAASLLGDNCSNPATDPLSLRGSHVLLGRLACDRKDLSAAIRELALSRAAVSERVPPVPDSPDINRLQGQIELLNKNWPLAGGFFDREADSCRGAAMDRRISGALARAGAAYLLAGDSPTAADRYYRAARSASARGDRSAAKTFLDLAAAHAVNPQLRQLIAAASADVTRADVP